MRRTIVATLVGIAALGLAHGHAIHFPKRALLDVEDGLVRLVIRHVHSGECHGREIRERFDRNADGRIDRREYAALERYLVRRSVAPVEVLVDGRPVEMSVRMQTMFGHEGHALSSEHLGIHVVLTGELPPEGRELEYRDAHREGRELVALEVHARGLELEAPATGRLEDADGGDETRVRGALVGREQVFRATLR